MAIIESSIKIDAPSKTVWDLVSDLDAEPKYWKGTKTMSCAAEKRWAHQ